MIAFFQSSVASAFLKAIQFFCMANASVNTVPFEKLDSHGTDIERYIEDLLNGYNAHGDASKRMQDYRVIELRRCKERTEVGHEYVSAKVVGPDPISTFYIMFERFRGPDDPNTKRTDPAVEIADERKSPRFDHVKAIVQASSEAIQASGDNLSKQSSPCLRDGRAHDRVSTFDEPTKNRKDEIKRTVIFKDSIPLYKVAVLAHSVHCSEKTYALNSSSCYFYATAVMQAMEQAYKNEIDRQSDSNTAGTKPGMVPLFQRTPISKSYSKTKIDSKACQNIINIYESELRTFEEKAQIKDRQLELERTRANEATARADCEAKRAREVDAENVRLREELAAMQAHAARSGAAQSERRGTVSGA